MQSRGLRIVDYEGQHLRRKRGTVRLLCWLALALVPFAQLLFLWVFFDRRHQGLHDKIAGSLVVRESASHLRATVDPLTAG